MIKVDQFIDKTCSRNVFRNRYFNSLKALNNINIEDEFFFPSFKLNSFFKQNQKNKQNFLHLPKQNSTINISKILNKQIKYPKILIKEEKQKSQDELNVSMNEEIDKDKMILTLKENFWGIIQGIPKSGNRTAKTKKNFGHNPSIKCHQLYEKNKILNDIKHLDKFTSQRSKFKVLPLINRKMKLFNQLGQNTPMTFSPSAKNFRIQGKHFIGN